MTRENSNIQPLQSLVELDPKGYACISLVDPASVQESTDDDNNPVYEYNRYTIQRRCNAGFLAHLATSVSENFNAWLSLAKAEDEASAAAAVRKIRDALLEKSDRCMVLDRMGLEIPSGSTITAWLSFLRGLGSVITGEWARYRQALRDLPQQAGFPYDVEFPTPPDDE